MKSIYILLTKSDTWVSKLIRLSTDDKYTHASISFAESLQPLYSFSRKFVNLPLPAGLRTEPLTKGFFRKYHYIPCALYELKVDDGVYWTARREVERMMADAPQLPLQRPWPDFVPAEHSLPSGTAVFLLGVCQRSAEPEQSSAAAQGTVADAAQ